ncbi:MAG: haloacid dehalogenase, partial [Pseudanabaenales cyanobacterium]|nr:haloacid dehalogenase [Pseudanabaenales cyanobacterium]
REFTEPFRTPKNVPTDQLKQAVHEMGFQVVVGDRFSHLIGSEAGKGKAVRQLTQLYQSALPKSVQLTTIGLGNSPNDLGMLENVKIPVIVPSSQGPHPDLSERNWQVAPAPGPQGWAMAVEKICQELGIRD